MKLSSVFNKTIYDIGFNDLEHPVFYNVPIGIRFEIGGEEDVYIKKGMTRKLHPNPIYVNDAVARASRIFDSLPKKDWILRIDLSGEKEIKKILKVLQLVESHEKVLKEYEEDGEKISYYELYWSLNDINWPRERIIREIVLADIGGLNCLASSVYLLQPNERILYHLYDDRGLDLVAQDKGKLYPLYEKFNDWILDYDRALIDNTFKNKEETFEYNNLLDFLNQLEEKNIYYQLNKIRDEAIMIEVTVPGQKWEIEFLDDGTVDIEKFISNQDLYDVRELSVLLKEFAD